MFRRYIIPPVRGLRLSRSLRSGIHLHVGRNVVRIILALVLAWSLFPGTRELTEQVLHVVRNGHLAHSIPNDPDAAPDDCEHGCQGPMHVCRCCHSVPLLISGGVAPLERAASISEVTWASSAMHGHLHVVGVFHPPRA